ncbi:MAG: SufD family Fe-S cluster assembly protein [Firmicutes bacterium]|nr:SufD family Fe-S cluster assembly protein [Bacillota bacterium]
MAQLTSLTSRAALEAEARRRGEPDWLREFRLRAWDLALGLDLPSRTDEKWRRTDLTGLDLGRVSPEVPAGAPQEVPEAFAPMVGEGKTLVLRNGVAVRVPEGLPAGVIVTDLETAARQYPDLVQPHLMTQAVRPEESIFTALHAAFFRGGAFVYLPRGAQVEDPIQILTWADGPGAGLLGHTLVVAEEGASARVVEYWASAAVPEGTPHLGVVEILTGPGARIDYSGVQNWGPGVWSFTTRRTKVGRDARVNWLLAEFGGELVRSEQYTALDQEGGEGNLKVLFFGSGNQHIDIVAEDLHYPTGRRTVGDIVGRGVLQDQARVVFRGKGHIMRGAKGSTCFLRENALMLNRGCRADSIPSLFIDDDQVERAGHAATSGKVDEDELFYLMSRGLTRKQATRLIVEGFFKPILDTVELPALRRELESLVDRKLGL